MGDLLFPVWALTLGDSSLGILHTFGLLSLVVSAAALQGSSQDCRSARKPLGLPTDFFSAPHEEFLCVELAKKLDAVVTRGSEATVLKSSRYETRSSIREI